MIMANIGTTITPWQIFFQQSAVVDKGMDVHDIKFGKIDTFAGSFSHGPGGDLHHHRHGRRLLLPHGRRSRSSDAKQTAEALSPLLAAGGGRMGAAAVRHRPVRRRFPRRALHLAFHLVGGGRGVRLGPLAEPERSRCALVLRDLPADARDRRSRGADPGRTADHDHDVRPGGGGDTACRRR